MLGVLIPGSGRDFADRPLGVLVLDQALLTVARGLGTTFLATPVAQESSLWLLPVSGFALLWSLTSYNTSMALSEAQSDRLEMQETVL